MARFLLVNLFILEKSLQNILEGHYMPPALDKVLERYEAGEKKRNNNLIYSKKLFTEKYILRQLKEMRRALYFYTPSSRAILIF